MNTLTPAAASANGFIQGIAACVLFVVGVVALMTVIEHLLHREAVLIPTVLRGLLVLACFALVVRVALRAFGVIG